MLKMLVQHADGSWRIALVPVVNRQQVLRTLLCTARGQCSVMGRLVQQDGDRRHLLRLGPGLQRDGLLWQHARTRVFDGDTVHLHGPVFNIKRCFAARALQLLGQSLGQPNGVVLVGFSL